MYEFWYDYVKPKYDEKVKLCFMGTDIIVFIKTGNIYKEIAENVERKFDMSNCKLERLLQKGNKKKVIGFIKDKLGWKIMKKSVGLRRKTHGIRMTQKSVSQNKNLNLKIYKNWLKPTRLENKLNDLEKNKANIDILRENHKEFINNNKLILKAHQKFKSKKLTKIIYLLKKLPRLH